MSLTSRSMWSEVVDFTEPMPTRPLSVTTGRTLDQGRAVCVAVLVTNGVPLARHATSGWPPVKIVNFEDGAQTRVHVVSFRSERCPSWSGRWGELRGKGGRTLAVLR